MSISSEIKELKIIAKSAAAIGFLLWSVFPMFLLGWLLSAIGRHPIAEEQIKSEPVYEFLLWWQGGFNSFPLIFLLMIFLTGFTALSYAFWKSGYSHPTDGMGKMGVILRKFLIPAYLSFSSFAGGVLSGGTLAEMKPGLLLLMLLTVFAGFVHYVSDTFQPG